MLGNYLKIAVKVLLRRKFFTFVSLFGVSVTLLVLLVATAMLDSIFAPQAPETRGARTLGIYDVAMVGPESAYTGRAGYALLDLNRDDGTTVAMVTHDPRLADRTQRTVRLFDGRQVL